MIQKIFKTLIGAFELIAMITINIFVYRAKHPVDDRVLFCYRITPPNLTILSPTEKEEKIRHFYGLLSSLDTPLQILAMDKTENMKANKAFCDSLHENYDFVGEAILRRINEIEQDLSGIQRAFYFIINTSDKAKKNTFEALLQQNDFKYTLVDRAELITMLRNLLLREYADTELYLLENELRKFRGILWI